MPGADAVNSDYFEFLALEERELEELRELEAEFFELRLVLLVVFCALFAEDLLLQLVALLEVRF